MAQILNLSNRFTKEQIESTKGGSFKDLPAGGYVCKIVDSILNDDREAGKENIELHVDIAEGEFAGYFQNLEDRYGFWGLRGWMSFKESQIGKFQQTCVALCNSNPGLAFDPLHGDADVDDLKGKQIGVVIRKEEYQHSSGDIREKDTVYFFTEIDKIRKGKFKVPEVKKLAQDNFVPANDEEIPY